MKKEVGQSKSGPHKRAAVKCILFLKKDRTKNPQVELLSIYILCIYKEVSGQG